jgi:peptide/nickel transport system substrate-binding protein
MRARVFITCLLIACAHPVFAETTLIEAVAAMPTALAYDQIGPGYENLEFNLNTNATLVRNPYVRDASGALGEDVTRFEPYLAQSYDVSDDGLVYTFHLRPDVRAAGNPLTVDDVLWSYERKWNSRTATPFVSAPIITDPSKQFVKRDDHTLAIHVARRSDGFTLLGLLANVTAEIYDSTLLKAHATPADPYAVAWSATRGNFGFGPYQVASFTAGQELVLTASPNAVLGKPKIDRIIERVVSDPGTRATLLKNGDVDIATQLRPADLADLAHDPDVKTFTNQTNNIVYVTMRTTSAPFDQLAVRQAMTYAIPYKEILDQVYRGRGGLRAGLINPGYPNAITTGLRTPAYDPAKAKALLAAAGITTPVKVSLTVSNAVPDLQDASIAIRSAAAAAGFDITINLLPPAALQQALSTGNFQLSILRDNAITLSPPYELLLYLARGSVLNRAKFDNDAFYAAVERGVEAGDPLSAAAAPAWNEAQQIWQEQAPYTILAWVEPLSAMRADIDGFAWRSDNIIDFYLLSKK